MSSVCFGRLRAKHDVGASVRANTHVLLTQMLHLGLDGRASLLKIESETGTRRTQGSDAYQLLLQGHFLQLHLVDSSVGGAGKSRGGN